MNERAIYLEPVDDAYVERLARILGDSSGAAKAIAERNRRRAAGERADVFLDRLGAWVVGPSVAPTP